MFQHVVAMGGLALTILGWALQYRHQLKHDKKIAREFVGLNAIGTMMWVLDAVQTGMYEMALMYVFVLAVSMLVFFKTD